MFFSVFTWEWQPHDFNHILGAMNDSFTYIDADIDS